MKNTVCNQIKKAAYSAALQLRGKDLNLRPLGYETQLTLPALAFSIISGRMLTYFADVSRSFGPIFGPIPIEFRTGLQSSKV